MAASSAPVAGGAVWSVSAGATVVTSGGGVGRFLVDMAKVEVQSETKWTQRV